MPKQTGVKQIAANRKAFHDYFVLERFEAGIELAGTEVKSLRAGTVNMKDSYCTIKNGEIFIRSLHIQDGVALIPLSMYFKNSRAKVELGLCKGKKLYDKRNDDAKREAMRDIERTMKERN